MKIAVALLTVASFGTMFAADKPADKSDTHEAGKMKKHKKAKKEKMDKMGKMDKSATK